eukprot:gene14665-biopygen8118
MVGVANPWERFPRFRSVPGALPENSAGMFLGIWSSPGICHTSRCAPRDVIHREAGAARTRVQHGAPCGTTWDDPESNAEQPRCRGPALHPSWPRGSQAMPAPRPRHCPMTPGSGLGGCY